MCEKYEKKFEVEGNIEYDGVDYYIDGKTIYYPNDILEDFKDKRVRIRFEVIE